VAPSARYGTVMPASLVFPRGSHVLEYWLAHAEGFTVRSRGPVERVIVEPLYGRATALVVRSGRLRRRQVVSAAEVTSVDPEARVLEVEVPEPRPRAPSRTAARARSAHAWLTPRLREAWAGTLTVLAAALEAGRSLYARGVRWYAERGDAPYLYDRHSQYRARPRLRVGAGGGARAHGGAAAARDRRPRGAVGRHLRP
jgi:hypothetical protein